MNDTELNRQILGLEKPWGVDKVELDVAGGQVDAFVKHELAQRWASIASASWPGSTTSKSGFGSAVFWASSPRLSTPPEFTQISWISAENRTLLQARVPRVFRLLGVHPAGRPAT